jgi:hypothetical protein
MTRISSHGEPRFPGVLEELLPDTEEIQTNGDTEGEGEGEWEVVDDDNKESQAAVDRVLTHREVQNIKTIYSKFVANPNIFCIMNATNNYERKPTNGRARTNYR